MYDTFIDTFGNKDHLNMYKITRFVKMFTQVGRGGGKIRKETEERREGKEGQY